MARPIFQHELSDPDFQWLISTYRETHAGVTVVESTCLPVVLLLQESDVAMTVETESPDSITPIGPTAPPTGTLADEPDL